MAVQRETRAILIQHLKPGPSDVTSFHPIYFTTLSLPSFLSPIMSATYEESQIRLLAYPIDEKWAANQDDLVNSNEIPATRDHCCNGTSRGHERNKFVKCGIIALVVSLMALISFLATAVVCPGMRSLLKRETSGSNTTGSGSTFTNDKLWIIIICVVGTDPSEM